MSYYLAEAGWDITVITSGNPDYPYLDPQLADKVHNNIHVHKVKSFEPRLWLKALKSIFKSDQNNQRENLDNALNNPEDNPGIWNRIILWIRSNVFIPDARVGWAKAVRKNALQAFSQQDFDWVISTGPPHSTHLAGQYLQTKWGVRWVADFRDPWMEIEFFDHLTLTKTSLQKHKELESLMLSSADLVTTVSPSWAELFKSKGAINTAVVFNGYDEKDYREKADRESTPHFRIIHLGTWGKDRDIPELYRAIKAISNKTDKKVILEWAGQIDVAVRQSIIELLDDNVGWVDHGFISHNAAIHLSQQADLLLLIQNQAPKNIKGRIPAKCFEYMATQRPILLIGQSNTDMAAIIEDYPLGYFAEFEDEKTIEAHILSVIDEGKMLINNQTKPIDFYSRKHQAYELHKLLIEQQSKI